MFAANNLELRITRSRAAEASGSARQAGAFPNPTLTGTHEPLSGDGRSYSESYLNLSQRFELPGERGARADAGRQTARAAALQYRADSLRLAFGTKRTYVEAALAAERLAITERVTEVFRESTRSAEARFEDGDLSAYAVRRIQVERARYETLLADAMLSLQARERALALMIAPDGDAVRIGTEPLPASTPPEISTSVLEDPSPERRPELEAARADLAAADARVRLARAERIPDLTATGGFKRQSDGLAGAFLGLSVPVPFFDRGGGAVEAADAGTEAARARLDLVRRQLVNDALQARESYRTLLERAELMSSGTSPAAGGDLLDMATVAYAEGEMDLVALLDAADAFHRALTAEADRLADLWIAYFDLERALGGFAAAGASSMEDGR